MQKSDKMDFRRALALNVRAFKIWWKTDPAIILSLAAAKISEALFPYVGIYFSARIINELAGARDPKSLLRLVLATLLVTLPMELLKVAATHWQRSKYETQWCKRDGFFAHKMLEMDFATLDKQETYDMRSQIGQMDQWTNRGMLRTLRYFEQSVEALTRILGAVVLSISLFTLPVPQSAGAFTALNHPLCLVLIIAAMLLATFIAPACTTKADSYWNNNAESAKMGNRFFSFFGFMSKEHDRALDIRVYRQEKICRSYFTKIKSFVPGSPIAKAAHGPMGVFSAMGAAVSTVFIGIVYVFVCMKAWAGAFGIGSVTQYIGAIVSLSTAVSALLEIIGTMRSNAPTLAMSIEFLDIPNDMYQGSLTTEKRSDRNYEIEFRDVSFCYPGTEAWVLRHVNMKFRVGRRLAVVGENGSGKTTFIKLLCRMYDPTEGEILLNGIDIRKYDYDDYLALFSVVFQDFKLLALTLGENVAARGEYDRTRVEKCLGQAGFGARLQEMPAQLETYLHHDFDEHGVEVSGGEAQKIAIARALYKDAPFIILDEPTAALDPVAEYEVYSKFNELVGDKTAIYISHRLSSCRFCDEIAVFEAGQLVQKGAHGQLIEDEQGKYHQLWMAQAQYYA